MLFNILLVFLVTCFVSTTIPETLLAKENKPDITDVVIENAAAVQENNEEDNDTFPEIDVDESEDEDELGKEEAVSFDPTENRDISFNFDELEENDKD
ncbi:hypothetical protein FJ365_01685 [Candidatus Dependentiae bacterium]|nr:hypothetical protein [Candidatus Dependentiae bacterium]